MKFSNSPKSQAFFSFVIGLALIAYAVYAHLDITAWEQTGGSYRMPRLISVIYDIAGVWAVSGLIALTGVYFLYNGVKRYHADSEAENGQTQD